MANKKPNYPEYVSLPWLHQDIAEQVQSLEKIKQSLQQGYMFIAAHTVDQMVSSDPIIYGALQTRLGTITACEREFVPANDTKKAQMICEIVEKLYDDMIDPSQLYLLMQWGAVLGIGLAENIWNKVDGFYLPQLTCWHPQYVRFDWSTYRYRLITEKEEIEIKDDNGQWVLYTPYTYDFSFQRSLFLPLVVPWLSRRWASRDWNRANEVFGIPLICAKVPTLEDAQPQVARFMGQLDNLGSESVFLLPQYPDGQASFELDIKQASSSVHDSFNALIQQQNKEIAIAILGQHTSTFGQPGLGAQERPGEAVRTDIKKMDAKISHYIREQVLKWFCYYNFGDAELAPYVNYVVEPKEDALKQAQTYKELAQSLDILKSHGVDITKLLEQGGFPISYEETEEIEQKEESKEPDKQEHQDTSIDDSTDDNTDEETDDTEGDE